MLKYWGDPENDFITRYDMHMNVLKIANMTFYHHFRPSEISEIEAEAVEIRKKASSRQRAHVLEALYKRAVGYKHIDIHFSTYEGEVTETEYLKVYPPDKAAAEEYLNRTEGKVIDKKEIKVDGKDLVPIINVTTTGN